MDFSPVVPIHGNVLAASERYIASIYLPKRVVVRSTTSLKIKKVIVLDESFLRGVKEMTWREQNGENILVLFSNTQVKILDIIAESTIEVMQTPDANIKTAFWLDSQDDLAIITERGVTLWSLAQNIGTTIPAFNLSRSAIVSRPRSAQLSILFRDSKDHVLLVDKLASGSWVISHSFEPPTLQAQGCAWSFDGAWLSIWDTLISHGLFLYTADGRLFKTISDEDTGQVNSGIGIRCISWEPSSIRLALTSHDNRVTLFDPRLNGSITTLHHLPLNGRSDIPVWQQKCQADAAHYVLKSYAFTSLNCIEHDTSSIVDILSFSPAGHFLCTQTTGQTNALWIWSISEMRLVAVLNHHTPVKEVTWHPDRTGMLIITTLDCASSQRLSLSIWSSEWNFPKTVVVPQANFALTKFDLLHELDTDEVPILLRSSNSFTVAYPLDDIQDNDLSVVTEDYIEQTPLESNALSSAIPVR